MSLHFGIGTETLQRVMTGWAQATRQLQECPVPVRANAAPAKGYESGVLLGFNPRLVDIPVSPVRLPADFWRRAIQREHAA